MFDLIYTEGLFLREKVNSKSKPESKLGIQNNLFLAMNNIFKKKQTF